MKSATSDQMRLVADRLDRLLDDLPRGVMQSAAYHGARIVRDAKVLTPVDTGLLMNADTYDLEQTGNATVLVVSNRMKYARYQHERVLNHPNKRTARDHFIKIPFEAEVPAMVADIKALIMEATE